MRATSTLVSTLFITRKFILSALLALIVFAAGAQSFMNEWIDFNKTYYRFKVGSTGLYRIYGSDLENIGLMNQAGSAFQLWRNGKEVALFVSTGAAPLGAGGYIEFWGEKNDGLPDKELYRTAAHHISDRESLLTDTAAFFLTVNNGGSNLRFSNAANNVAGNTLPAEPYFMYNIRQTFKDQINRGAAEIVGEYVYSSTFDAGEMWSTRDINPGSPYGTTFTNLNVAANGPAASVYAAVAGSAGNTRSYTVTLNNTVVINGSLSGFDAKVEGTPSVQASLLASNTAAFSIRNNSGNQNDRMVCGFLELTYPRLFNFGQQSSFAFTLPASATAKYLEISNFNAGNTAPVLYDFTNLRRYPGVLEGGQVKFVIEPSASPASLVLVSQEAAAFTRVRSFATRNFINYQSAAVQGDYLIITHSILQAVYSGANQVELYRAYRSSAAGGGYNAKIIDIEQLVDQFSYGIKKNPLSIRNFLRFARSKFSVAPRFVFLMGKGLTYVDYRMNERNPLVESLDLVPTFGYPASDILLASQNLDPDLASLVSRLSVIYPQEVALYLDKVKQYEQAQKNPVYTLAEKAWMKNIVHVVGGSDANLDLRLSSFMRSYQSIIEDTLFGAKVTNFNKTTTGPVTPITNTLMSQLFETGIGIISYFGHSSSSSLDYNLNDPEDYNNTGKYPLFIASGCNAGDLFSFDTARRFSVNNTLSEKYTLAKEKGTIGFIASTHFGVDTYLDTYNRFLYNSISRSGYDSSISFNMKQAITGMLNVYGTGNRLARLHTEQITLHGDPALKANSFKKPDFIIEPPQIKITPGIVSVADTRFSLKAFVYNTGKASGDSVSVQVRHQYPGGQDSVILFKKIRLIRYIDSVAIDVPIVSSRDKGENKISVSLDVDNRYEELSETNNTATISFLIQSDELRPVYPYNYSIVNRQNVKLVASTAEPSGISRQYALEIDTTELFNSSGKVSRTAASTGGVIEFDPGIAFRDSTVYYWRVAPVPSNGNYIWNTSSFVYLNGSEAGFNQSHFYQHTKSATTDIRIDTASRKWKLGTSVNQLSVVNSIYPTSGNEDSHFSVMVNGNNIAQSACLGHSVIFNVFDPLTLKPLYNQAVPSVIRSGSPGGFMGSAASCAALREANFEFSYLDTSGRRKMRDFMDWVPSGYYVTVRLIFDTPYDLAPFADAWKNDAQVYGTGNTLYDRLKSAGFSNLDAYAFPRTWSFIYRKNTPAFQPVSAMSNGLFDRIITNIPIDLPKVSGQILSPQFGPATSWKEVIWRGAPEEATPGDVAGVNVIGITSSGQKDTLYRLSSNQQNFNIASVSATQYPYLQLSMSNSDPVTFTPYQLKYWRVYYTPVPEGALAANIAYKFRDTLEAGENLDMVIGFKNVSEYSFADSIVTAVTVFDRNNVATSIPVAKLKKLAPGDTAAVRVLLNTKAFTGNNTLFVDVNPNYAQPEQYRFNNFMYKSFFVRGDTYNPLLDVTFDGVHILNGDIVSAQPKIVIKLKDEAKFLALDDTSLVTVLVRYPPPSGATVRYGFGTDTLRFIPADLSTGKNEATVEFSPAFLQDSEGDYYELIVRAKDKSGNAAGNMEYRVRFQVYNKPMISNMFNYPNPFTTSTAFVFTITGSQVPQNIRIQIMTVTGKIVREITTAELGPLRVGRNITDFKWDGTDQYGQKLANGVYLYRVSTNLNGSSLEKFNITDSNGDRVDTDKYFNKGYGKMYLMR